MNKINVGRVLIAGLVAGLVLNFGEFLLNSVFLAKEMEADFKRLNLPPPSEMFILRAVGVTFLLGIVLVFLYAAIRPRFGPGIKTAACAGLIGWFFIYLYAGYLNEAIGFVSVKLYLVSLVWGLVEYLAAAIAGGWMYKEEG
ncbi:MAG: hypothetical protein SF339_12385 [Blastocatellia bacterium]|nr:hypothetical protein [Blastocatellia bacterium]